MISWEGEDLSPKKNKGILRYNVTEGTGSDNPTEGAYVDGNIILFNILC